MSNKKVSPEQLDVLQSLNAKYESLLREYGELNLKKRIIESQLGQVEGQFNELETTREELRTTLNQQFGELKSVNLETGEIEV